MENRKYLNVALPKGRLGEKVYSYFEREGMEAEGIREESRKLVFENAEGTLRFFWVKPSDVAIYVERGAAGIGVVGKDILLEYSPDVYELCDLGFGKCRMAVAGKKGMRIPTDRTIRVATKFSNIAWNYYSEQSRDIEIIKLNGSVELAPIVGLSEVIVDIVETGATLKENGLGVLEEICELSARMVVNQVSMKMENKRISDIIDKLRKLDE